MALADQVINDILNSSTANLQFGRYHSIVFKVSKSQLNRDPDQPSALTSFYKIYHKQTCFRQERSHHSVFTEGMSHQNTSVFLCFSAAHVGLPVDNPTNGKLEKEVNMYVLPQEHNKFSIISMIIVLKSPYEKVPSANKNTVFLYSCQMLCMYQ